MSFITCRRAAAISIMISTTGASAPADDTSSEAGWLSRLGKTVSDVTFLSATGPALAERLSGLMQLKQDARPNCLTSWSLGSNAPDFVRSASLDLLPSAAEPCDQARFGILLVMLNPAKEADITVLASDLTDRFGAPSHRRIGQHDETHWQVAPKVGIEISVSSDEAEADEIMFRAAQAP